MSMSRAVLVCVLAAALAGCAHRAAGQGYSCDTSSDAAVSLHDYLVQLVTEGDDTESAQTRVRYQLPRGSREIVRIEADASVCERAGVEYHRVWPQSSRGARIVVIRVGADRYVVVDPAAHVRASEFGVAVIFDRNWNKLAAFTV